jgi:hypothetical protein
MKKILISFATFFAVANGFAQDATIAHSINKESWEEELDVASQIQVGIEYPIFKVFEFEDSRGPALIVLTENNIGKNAKGEPINSAITAFMLRGSDGLYDKEWENTHDITKDVQSESSIWYWSKYFDCMDVDKDGESETFLVFGTAGDNGFDDGRVFIEIYYKGSLISIEHQNGVKDMERITLVSPEFYMIPQSVQNKVIYKMKQMETAKQTIFPNNWEQKMATKKTIIRN